MLQFWLNPLCQGAELLQAVQDMSDEEEEGGKEDKRYSRKQENSSYPEPSNEEATTSSAQYTQVPIASWSANAAYRYIEP